MKLKSLVFIIVALAAVVIVQSSVMVKKSLLKPMLPEPCFTSRAEDRPFAYPLFAFFNKIKDMFVRGLNALADVNKQNKLPKL